MEILVPRSSHNTSGLRTETDDSPLLLFWVESTTPAPLGPRVVYNGGDVSHECGNPRVNGAEGAHVDTDLRRWEKPLEGTRD